MINAVEARSLYLDYYDKNDTNLKDIENRIVDASNHGNHSVYCIIKCREKVIAYIEGKLEENGFKVSSYLVDNQKYLLSIDWSCVTDCWD